eukprot:gene8090-5627_t
MGLYGLRIIHFFCCFFYPFTLFFSFLLQASIHISKLRKRKRLYRSSNIFILVSIYIEETARLSLFLSFSGMLDWLGKRKVPGVVTGEKGSRGTSVELSLGIQREVFYPGDTLHGAAFVYLDRTFFTQPAKKDDALSAFTGAGAGPVNNNMRSSASVSSATSGISGSLPASLRVVVKGQRVVHLGVHDHISPMYCQDVVLYPPDPSGRIASSASVGTSQLFEAAGTAGEEILKEMQGLQFQRSSQVLQREGSYIFPFRFPLPSMLHWTEDIVTPPLIGIRSSFRYFMYLEIQLHNRKQITSPKLYFTVKPLPMPFWRWDLLKQAESLMMPEAPMPIIHTSLLPMSTTIHTFGVASPPLFSIGVSPAVSAGINAARRHKHRSRRSAKPPSQADGFSDPDGSTGNNVTPSPQAESVVDTPVMEEGGRKHKHKHKHRHRRHTSKANREQRGSTTPSSNTPALNGDQHTGIEDPCNTSLVSFDNPPGKECNGENPLYDPTACPLEKTLKVPLRTSIIHKSEVSIPVKLSSTVLIPGYKPLVVVLALNAKEDAGVAMISRIRASVSTRYTFMTPAQQRVKLSVVSDSSSSLKPASYSQGPIIETLRLVIPVDTPLSQVSEVTTVCTELSLKFFTHTTLKDFESKVIIPIILVGGVNRLSYASRRLAFWTNNYLHQAIQKEKADIKAEEIFPAINQAQRQVVEMAPQDLALLMHCAQVGTSGSYTVLDQKTEDGRKGHASTDTSSSSPNPSSAVLHYVVLMKIIKSDDPSIVVYVPTEEPTATVGGGKFYDPNPFQQTVLVEGSPIIE